MRREPALTFQGALRILGRAGTPGIDRLDTVLGGIVLGAGLLGLGGAPGPVAAISGT